MIIKNWIYYMQRGLQSMWKSKSTSDYKDKVIYSDSDYKECGCLPDCGCKE